MSVDWYGCKKCGETFPDCGDYTSCECGEMWCSDECAEKDGFKRESCKLEYDMDDNDCEESCYNCDNKIESSCKYCREEDFDDSILFKFALKSLGMERETLIQSYKLSKGGL